MRALRLLPAVLAAAVLTATAAAPAEAAMSRVFYGETARGEAVRAAASPDGTFGHAVVTFAVRCPKARVTARGSVAFEGTDVERSRREFSGVGTNSLDVARYSATVEGAMTGRRTLPRGRPGLERWAGLLELTVKLWRDDELAERCTVRDVRWDVRREAFGVVSWTMTGDPDDYIAGGRTYSYTGRDEIVAVGDRSAVEFSVDARNGDDWTARFAAPAGAKLVQGRTYAAERDPFNEAPFAGLDVGGNHRGCNEIVGSFTVERARFDRRGRMRAFTVRFEQHCEGGPDALRGRMSFRATLR